MTGKKIIFLFLFVFLNCLLFLPKYLIEFSTSTFLPFTDFLTGTFPERINSVFIRHNYDVFRLSVDLTAIVLIFYLFRHRINIRKYAWFAGIYYVIMLLFIVYYSILDKIFLVKPVLYDDISLFKLAVINSGGRMSFVLIAGILGLIGLTWLFVRLFRYLLTVVSEIRFGKSSKIILAVAGLLFLVNVYRSGLTFEPHHTFQVSVAMLADNVQYSAEAYSNLHRYDLKKPDLQMNYDQYQLEEQPNVYFLFVESYGKILYEHPDLREPYMTMINDCHDNLAAHGFHSCSAFSTSPVVGGGSWISYSSVMFGFNIENQATYLSLMKNVESYGYDHMFNWFRKKGYRNYRLVSIPDNENLRIPWDRYSLFYGADEWIRFKDLNYYGGQNGFGPSPPDQYSISFANDYIRKKEINPFTLFFISQNSHNPFYCPDSIVSDWRSLNNNLQKRPAESAFLKRPKSVDYSKAISYVMRTFIQFIILNGKNNDIFILIGDHQPPILTEKKDGFDTPVHIIVSDSLFCAGFSKYGFTQGMTISGNSRTIKHESIYSMFMHEFIRNYGSDTTHLPVYLPDGIKTEVHD